MKALVQRVSEGSVAIDGAVKASIGRGYVILLGVKQGDSEADAWYLAEKTANLRVFPDEQDKMNLSIMDIKGQALVISQFTLYADTRKGNRPSFIQAGPPEIAEDLYNKYAAALAAIMGPARVATGTFRAMMKVTIINDGPVTIELSSDHKAGA